MSGEDVLPVAPDPVDDGPAQAGCENCATPLQGEFCHTCGQSVHSPLRHAGHALEEVFESFWHLDGRIFRTLRDLVVPGRVAIDYVAGHRARYVAPLRLFVILSLLTFFVAQCSVQLDAETDIHFEPDTGLRIGSKEAAGGVDGVGSNVGLARATTVAEVERIRDAELADIAAARALVPRSIPAGTAGLDFAARELKAQAQRRITELQGGAGATAVPGAGAAPGTRVQAPKASPAAGSASPASTAARSEALPVAAATPARAVGSATPATAGEAASPGRATPTEEQPEPEAAWDAEGNPVSLPWLPAFANAWLTAQSVRASRNAMELRKDPKRYLRAVIGAVPSTLFVLVPVFALLLKVFYLFRRRLYLEHLVVALYSHAFLLLTLLAIFASITLRHAIDGAAPWLDTALVWLEALLWAWMPLYLLLMQKRVYGQGWPATLLKFGVLGTVYFMLLSFGAVATFFYGLVSM